MNGTVILLGLIFLLQINVLSSEEPYRHIRRRHDPCKPSSSAKCRISRRWRPFVAAVERRVKRNLDTKYNKKFDNLKKDFQRLENKTKEELKRIRLEHRCPYGFIPYRKHCFRFVMSESHWKTWEEARVHCQNIGANLLFLNSTLKHNFVVNYLKKNFDNHATSVFTSGIYCGANLVPFHWTPSGTDGSLKTWKWQGKNRTVGEDPKTLQWCSNKIPVANIRDIRSCLVLDKICEWQWSADKCLVPKPYICEMAKDPTKRICRTC